MKHRDQSLLNYTLFIILAIIGVFFLFGFNKNFPPDVQKLKSLQDTLQQKLNLTLNFIVPETAQNKQTVQQTINEVFGKQFYVEFNSQMASSSSFKVEILCKQAQEYSVEVVSGQEIQFSAGKECLNADTTHLKELRTLILAFTLNLLERSYDQRYLDKDIFFHIYLYPTFEGKQAEQLISQTKTALAQQIAQLANGLALAKESIRISFKTILPGEILDNSEILHNSSTTTSSNEDYQFIDLQTCSKLNDKLYGSYHDRISMRDFETIQLVVFLNEYSSTVLRDNEGTEGEYLKLEDNVFISANSPAAAQLAMTQTLLDFFELDELTQIAQHTHKTSIKADFHALGVFFKRREELGTYLSLHSQLVSTIKLIVDSPYTIFREHTKGLMATWISQVEKILEMGNSPSTTDSQALARLAREIIDLNRTDQIGEQDYFSDEYLMGVYLPIIIPVAYPYLLGIFGKLKEIKQARKVKTQ